LRADAYPNAAAIMEEFEIGPATASRDLDYLKYILKAPL